MPNNIDVVQGGGANYWNQKLLSDLGLLKGGQFDSLSQINKLPDTITGDYKALGDFGDEGTGDQSAFTSSNLTPGVNLDQFLHGLSNTAIDTTVGKADTSGFDTLAGQAAAAKTKGAGQNAINARGSYLANASDAQREAIRRKYYGNIASNYDMSGNDFNSLVAQQGGGGQGDTGYLAGLQDDSGGSGGSGGTDNVDHTTHQVGGTPPFDWGGWLNNFQQSLTNGVNSNSPQGTGSLTPASPSSLLSNDAGARAAARNSGLFGSIASRRLRGRRTASNRFF